MILSWPVFKCVCVCYRNHRCVTLLTSLVSLHVFLQVSSQERAAAGAEQQRSRLEARLLSASNEREARLAWRAARAATKVRHLALAQIIERLTHPSMLPPSSLSLLWCVMRFWETVLQQCWRG